MRPVERLYLRKHLREEQVARVARYLDSHAASEHKVTRERGGETLVHLARRDDVELMKQAFGDLIDAEVDLRR